MPRTGPATSGGPGVLLISSTHRATRSPEAIRHALREGRERGLRMHVIARTAPAMPPGELAALADTFSVVTGTGLRVHTLQAGDIAERAGGIRVVLGVDADGDTDHDLTVAAVAELLGVPGNPVESVRVTRDVAARRAALAAAGLDQPPWLLVADLRGAVAFLRAIPGPWRVRPASGGRGGSTVTRPAMLAAAVAAVSAGRRRGTPFLIEQWLDGPEFAVIGLFLGGRPHVLAVVERDDTGGLTQVVPAELPVRTRLLVEDAALGALAALGLCFGSFDIEVRLTTAGARVGEVRAHVTGDWWTTLLHHVVPGLQVGGLLYDDVLGSVPRPPQHPTRGAAVAHLTCPPGVVRRIDNWHRARAHPAVLHAELRFAPGHRVPYRPGGRVHVGTLLVGAETAARARTLARSLADSVRFSVDPEPVATPHRV